MKTIDETPKFFVKIQEIRTHSFLETKIPSVIQYKYGYLQKTMLISSFRKGMNVIAELIL